MAVRTIRTETQGGGRIRVSTRHEYYETPEEKRKRLAKTVRKEEETVKKIAGIEVTDEVYKEYADKRIEVPDMGTMPFSTIALYATSDSVAGAHPELHRKCLEIYKQIRTELQTQGKGKAYRHGSFTGYIEDLRKLYASAAAERDELKQKHQKDDEFYKQIERSGDTELKRVKAKADRLAAEESYKEQLADLQKRTKGNINQIRQLFAEHVSGFYDPTGSRLDADTIALLQSGLQLKASELAALVEKHKNNTTMLRLLGDYAKEHKVESPEVRVLYTRAVSGGSHELGAFDTVADMVMKAVSSDEVTAKVWRSESGLFDRLSNDVVQGLTNAVVKPE